MYKFGKKDYYYIRMLGQQNIKTSVLSHDKSVTKEKGRLKRYSHRKAQPYLRLV